MSSRAVVYLIPSLLHENGLHAIPSQISDTVKKCNVFFVENERTARRYLKQLWKSMVIDDYEWYNMTDAETIPVFKQRINEGKTIGIISEAGCPGVADPGQELVSIAQQMNVDIKPLVGPNSILLALMASGMNGQQFQFVGYIPVKEPERSKTIRDLETESAGKKCTQIFIETPYRNNQLIETILKAGKSSTRLCIAVDITGPEEMIKTKTLEEWKKQIPDIHKRPAIFLIYCEK
jgi:16S rRNA (cytidine1402-2'-O)-methyltransferase